jgi:hypothetical protein
MTRQARRRPPPRSAEGRPRWERPLIAALCVAAAVRVFLFAAAFPFFNNVDEQAHVDLILKYARGHWPGGAIERFDPDTRRLVLLYGTAEYFNPPERFPGGVVPRPLWPRPDLAAQVLAGPLGELPINQEVHSPPVYYAVAAAWYRLGGWLGLGDGQRLYWVRFLNAPLFALLVWGAYRFCRDWYPGRRELRLGVPLVLTFLPQDVFYSINSDVLSAPMFVVSLLLLLTWYARERPGAGLSAVLGLLVALTFLVKLTNVALPVVFAATVLLAVIRALRGGRAASVLPGAAVALSAAALPVALWLARNAVLLGDPTGTRMKIEHLGWSRRPLAALFTHPIFTPGGLFEFWNHLVRTLWRGELIWHYAPMTHPLLDGFYTGSATLLLIAAALARGLRARPAVPDERTPRGAEEIVDPVVWASVLLSVLCLAVLSVSFEYGRSFYPSAEHPYFTSGRLVTGALVPFFVLYLDGLAFVMRPVARTVDPLVVVALVSLVMTVSDGALTAPIFASPDNWFHLR